MKSVKITPPKGYEVDKENSTFEEIKFKPIDYLTLSNVISKVIGTNRADSIKALAFERFVQIARYYNGNWYPNWYDINEHKYSIYISEGTYFVASCISTTNCYVLFKNKEDAQAVIDNPNFREILDTLYK